MKMFAQDVATTAAFYNFNDDTVQIRKGLRIA